MQLNHALVDERAKVIKQTGDLSYWIKGGTGTASVPPTALQPLMALQTLQCAQVSHCVGARALVFTAAPAPPQSPSSEGPTLTVAFSGDCRPSTAFAVLGRDADVLVHEATFGEELRGMAIAKKHSTVDEAVCVAEAMGARSVVLTHFSQRYQKLSLLVPTRNQRLLWHAVLYMMVTLPAHLMQQRRQIFSKQMTGCM
jgi:ribonuclease BN (tRNA processing enzyme)